MKRRAELIQKMTGQSDPENGPETANQPRPPQPEIQAGVSEQVDIDQLLGLIDRQPLIGYVVHRDFTPLATNDVCALMFGYTSVSALLEVGSLLDLMPGSVHVIVRAKYRAVISQEIQPELDVYELKRKTGETFWVEQHAQRVIYKDQPAVLTFVKEITNEVIRSRELLRAQDKLQNLFDQTLELVPVGLSVYSADMRLFAWNSEYCRLADLPEDQVYIGMSLEERIALELNQFPESDAPEIDINKLIEYWETNSEIVQLDKFPNGRYIETRGRKVDEDKIVYCYLDVTERQRNEQRLKLLSECDSLTGVLNRGSFIEVGSELIIQVPDTFHTASVVMIDLDNFKDINDTYGHVAGDHVLKDFAAVVTSLLREQDKIGRMGGEEFCLMLPGAAREQAKAIALRIVDELQHRQVKTGGQTIAYTASIGVAELKPDEDMEHVYDRADMALYQAKDKGRARVEVAD